jgi:hypothetical protein
MLRAEPESARAGWAGGVMGDGELCRDIVEPIRNSVWGSGRETGAPPLQLDPGIERSLS